ncbi:MAG: hypothetical protein E7343_01675 [Clostridiales bacterium]|nr:hypothetical protein [Clostridiales bacterium]
MENEIKVKDEISIADIFSCLIAKLRLLIVLFLAGVIVGGTFGYLKSYNVVYYGTEMSFFVSPEKTSSSMDEDNSIFAGTYGHTVMDTMIKLLSTEKTAEEFVSGMNIEGLPQKPDPTAEPDVYARQVKEYNQLINTVKSSMTFTYSKTAKTEINTLDTESKNFIYVTLEVKEQGIYNKEFTAELLTQLQEKIPKIVERTMLNPDEEKYKTTCTLVTPLYPIVECMNENYTFTETVKFGAILGLVVAVLSCIVVIAADRLDKRVKETEQIEKKIGVPVLGVVPNILPQNETEKKGDELNG